MKVPAFSYVWIKLRHCGHAERRCACKAAARPAPTISLPELEGTTRISSGRNCISGALVRRIFFNCTGVSVIPLVPLCRIRTAKLDATRAQVEQSPSAARGPQPRRSEIRIADSGTQIRKPTGSFENVRFRRAPYNNSLTGPRCADIDKSRAGEKRKGAPWL